MAAPAKRVLRHTSGLGSPEQFGLLEELLLISSNLVNAVVLVAATRDDSEIAECLHREQFARENLTNLAAHRHTVVSNLHSSGVPTRTHTHAVRGGEVPIPVHGTVGAETRHSHGPGWRGPHTSTRHSGARDAALTRSGLARFSSARSTLVRTKIVRFPVGSIRDTSSVEQTHTHTHSPMTLPTKDH